jgi:hypothetical protein
VVLLHRASRWGCDESQLALANRGTGPSKQKGNHLATIAAIIATRIERHLREGLARSEEDVAAIVADYRALATDPLRKDLASKHGVGADILDLGQRTLEFRNWLETQVLPFAARR